MKRSINDCITTAMKALAVAESVTKDLETKLQASRSIENTLHRLIGRHQGTKSELDIATERFYCFDDDSANGTGQCKEQCVICRS